MRYELTDFGWTAIRPFLPNKPRGVPSVNDRRVRNGEFSITLAKQQAQLSSPRKRGTGNHRRRWFELTPRRAGSPGQAG
jgi:transposase